MQIARTEAGSEISPLSAGVPPGDYVVGQFDEQGRKTRRGLTAGGTVTEARIKAKLTEFMERKGEKIPVNNVTAPPATEPAPTPRKRGPKPKVKPSVQTSTPARDEAVYPQYEPEPVVAIPAAQQTTVEFIIASGKIKVHVDAILDGDTGLALVFKNDDEIRFVPEQGNELTLIINGKTVPVMYLGHLYHWYVGTQKIMTFIKTNPEE